MIALIVGSLIAIYIVFKIVGGFFLIWFFVAFGALSCIATGITRWAVAIPAPNRSVSAYDSRTTLAVWALIRKARMEAFVKHHPVLFLSWTTAKLAAVFSPILIIIGVIVAIY